MSLILGTPQTLLNFQQGTVVNPTDFLVGYNANTATTGSLIGSERKWTANMLGEYVRAFVADRVPSQATAWVNFNGLVNVGQNCTIISGHNVASVSRTTNAIGCNTRVSRFQINFLNPMINSNYAVIGLAQVGSYATPGSESNDQHLGVYSKATNTLTNSIVSVFDSNNRDSVGEYQRSEMISVAFFGGK